MYQEIIIDSRPDREIRKKIIKPGDYTLVPYEDARCKIVLTNIKIANEATNSPIESESRIFSSSFNGIVLIGDSDSYIDKDFELILQQMCSGETSEAKIVYKDGGGKVVMDVSCTVELVEVTEEQLISDWSWARLYEAAMHHKEHGVELVKEKRIPDAFRRFSKALKMLVAIEPIDHQVVDEEKMKEIIELRVKLYNNLAYCQLYYNEYEAALQLCNCAIKYDPHNVKALYRRCLAYSGLNLLEEAWADVQLVLTIDPNAKSAQQKANLLRPQIEKKNNDYSKVIKKMFA